MSKERDTGRRPAGEAGQATGAQAGREFFRSRAWWGRAGRTSLAAWLSTALTLAATILAARALGPEEYGAVVLAVAATNLIAVFLDVTLEEAVVHHGTKAATAGDHSSLRALLRRSLVLDVTVGVGVAAIVVALAGPIADVASAGRLDPSLIRLAALAPLASTADSTTTAVLLVAGRPDLRAWNMVFANVMRCAGVVVAVALDGAEAVLIGYAAAAAAGGLLQGAVAWRVAWRRWAAAPRGRPPASASALFRFGFHTSVTTSMAAIQLSLLQVVLGRLSGPAAVGVFKVAMLPVVAADTLTGPIRLFLFPEQSMLVAQGRIAELRRYMAVYSVLGLAIGAAGAAIGWFLLPVVIPLLYSTEFESAVTPARILLIAAVVHFGLSWSKTFPAALGRPAVRTALTGLLLALMLGLLLLLGDRGSDGAAIAFSAATVVTAAVWLVVADRLARREAERQRERGEPRQGAPSGRLPDSAAAKV